VYLQARQLAELVPYRGGLTDIVANFRAEGVLLLRFDYANVQEVGHSALYLGRSAFHLGP